MSNEVIEYSLMRERNKKDGCSEKQWIERSERATSSTSISRMLMPQRIEIEAKANFFFQMQLNKIYEQRERERER